MATLMACGHTAQGQRQDGSEVCVICVGSHPGADVPASTTPDLTGRKAVCGSHRGPTPAAGWPDSSLRLAFFEYRPLRNNDEYYCGCWGWD